MNPSLNITLYHAAWCGHCVAFKPEWNKFQAMMKKNGNNVNGVKVKINTIEDTEAERTGGAKINSKPIDGFPTIKLGLSDGKNSKEYEYLKSRNPDEIMKYVDKITAGLAKMNPPKK